MYFRLKNEISFRELQDQANFVAAGWSRHVTEKSLVQLPYVSVSGGFNAPMLKTADVVHNVMLKAE